MGAPSRYLPIMDIGNIDIFINILDSLELGIKSFVSSIVCQYLGSCLNAPFWDSLGSA